MQLFVDYSKSFSHLWNTDSELFEMTISTSDVEMNFIISLNASSCTYHDVWMQIYQSIFSCMILGWFNWSNYSIPPDRIDACLKNKSDWPIGNGNLALIKNAHEMGYFNISVFFYSSIPHFKSSPKKEKKNPRSNNFITVKVFDWNLIKKK